MGKTEVQNLDSKSKLIILSGIIANAEKDIESLKTEINDFKIDHEMPKKNLNSVNNEFIEYLKGSLKVSDNLIKINIDILMTKNKSYINIKNRNHIIRNDTLINKTNRIKLESMIRKNVESLKNIKNNHYSVKKYTDSLSIDLKKLKEEHINNSNKRVKVRSIVINNIANLYNRKVNRFTERLNKSLSKINARTKKDSAIVKNQVDACSIKDDKPSNNDNNDNKPGNNDNKDNNNNQDNNDNKESS